MKSPFTTNVALAQSGCPYNAQTPASPVQPETPTRWLCRLGPWQKQFEEHEIAEVVDWAQQKTGYWAGQWDNSMLGMRQYYISKVAECVTTDGRMSEEAFGRIMRVDQIPLKPARVQVKLPRFYEWSDMGAWTDVETDLILEDENGSHVVTFTEDFSYVSVFLRLEAGGRYCVADLATRDQANSLAAVLMSGAQWFAGSTQSEDDEDVEYNYESPDGITISNANFATKEEADKYLEEWVARCERQGYYSSNNGRIPLSELRDRCELLELGIGDR